MSASRKIAVSVLPDSSMPANPSGIPHSSAKTSRIASAPAAPVLINVASISNSTSFMALHVLPHVQVPVSAQRSALMHRIVGSLSTERKRKVLASWSASRMPVDTWSRPVYTRQHRARRLLSGALHRRRVAALWSRRKALCPYWYLGGQVLLVRGPSGGWWHAVNTWYVWISI